jgi:prephenate dehydrogenase
MPNRIGISGVGLIGGSIARRAATAGWTVGVFDVDGDHARYACERLGATFAVPSFAELAACSDVLVLAAPLDATLAQLAELASAPASHLALILDVASVKVPVARAGAALASFVATHPIAGSERSGPAAARADLFEGRVWSYDAEAAAGTRARAVSFIEAMGARPVAIASHEHDRIVALTSHLPQLVAVALGAQLGSRLDDSDSVAAFCGTGMQSMLRLAGSSWSVWEAVLRANARPVAQEVRTLGNILSDIAEALDDDAPGTLAERFSRAAAAHRALYANDER